MNKVIEYFTAEKAEADEALGTTPWEQSKYQTNHWLHAILSVVSGGTWLTIYFFCTIINTNNRNALRTKHNESYGAGDQVNLENNYGIALLFLFLSAMVLFHVM